MRRVLNICIGLLVLIIGLISKCGEVKAAENVVEDLKIHFAKGWIVEEKHKDNKNYMIATSPDKKYKVTVSIYKDKETSKIKDFDKVSHKELEKFLKEKIPFSKDDNDIVEKNDVSIDKVNSINFVIQDIIREQNNQSICERRLYTIRNGKGITITINYYGKEFDNNLEDLFSSLMFVEETTYVSFKKVLWIVSSIGLFVILFLIAMIIYHSKNEKENKYFA